MSYKGDLINDLNVERRDHDSDRLTVGYQKSKCVKSYLDNYKNKKMEDLSETFQEYIRKLQNSLSNESLKTHINQEKGQLYPEIFVAHEGLHLEYEAAMTKCENGKYYAQSAHLLWIGNRTRNIPGGHIEFFRNIENPIGLKIDSKISKQEFIDLVKTLNAENRAEKLVVITRFGRNNAKTNILDIIEAKQSLSLNFIWMIDPMHGNTYTSGNGFKTRDYIAVVEELIEVAKILKENGEQLGGIHLESTFENVTEVIGGTDFQVNEDILPLNYRTGCDPRLNCTQTLELISAFGKSFKL